MSSVQSIERMLQIIECFTQEKSELMIKDIVAKTQLNKTTIFRILSTLEQHNYINRNSETHKYSLGINFFKIGSISHNTFNIRKVVFPFMKKINDEIEEAVSLNIIDQNKRLCIEKLDSPRTIINFVNIGHSNPLHIGASGKCLLANWHEEKRNQYLSSLSLTDNENIELLNEIKQILSDGFAISKSERNTGSFAISSPIFNYDGEILASLTITGPLTRIDKERFTDILFSVTSEINSSLGYQK